MKTQAEDNDGLLLVGLDGSNPLAFLASLGVLRVLTIALPDHYVRLSWTMHAGAWRPVVFTKVRLSERQCVDLLHGQLLQMDGHLALNLADDLNVKVATFREFATRCVEMAHQATTSDRRTATDFAAAFACDGVSNEDGVVLDTGLRTMSGAGHQHFLAFMRHIVRNTTPDHLEKTLFATWTYEDAVTNQSLRWDPADDNRYALQWRDPSGDPTRKNRGAMLGANRLAIEGLPLVTSVPQQSKLKTVGFTGRGARDTFWTWPIWQHPVSVDVCRSLLSLSMLVDDDPQSPSVLRSLGIATAFRSRRITVGKFRNFTPAVAVY